MNPDEQQVVLLSTLIQLERHARHAETVPELGFVMVNETLRLLPYRQAVFWTTGPDGRIRIISVSGTDQPASDAPFIQDLTELVKKLIASQSMDSGRHLIALPMPERNEETFRIREKWSLQHLLWCPLLQPDNQPSGGLLLIRDTPWREGETVLVQHLLDGYGHALWALKLHCQSSGKQLAAFLRTGRTKLILTTLAVFALFLPVRLSVLAPMEIVPQNPVIVSSPMDGVVSDIHVRPNEPVEKGRLLFNLEDTTMRNRYEVSRKALEVVRAEHMKAVQKAFKDQESRAQMLMLKAEVAMKEAEMNYAEEVLQLSRVHALQDGIAVYGEQEDWLGKPVVVGQKIMIIADQNKVEAEIMLQVKDALTLEPGADVRLFLNTAPDRPLQATLDRADYQARVTEVGELAFRLRAILSEKPPPRIGLRGTAKIYGQKVPLVFYLLRRPLTVIRVAIGI